MLNAARSGTEKFLLDNLSPPLKDRVDRGCINGGSSERESKNVWGKANIKKLKHYSWRRRGGSNKLKRDKIVKILISKKITMNWR